MSEEVGVVLVGESPTHSGAAESFQNLHLRPCRKNLINILEQQ